MTFRHLTVPESSDVAPVSRRDFLKLRVREGRKVLELYCERFYMRYHDACSDAGRRQVSNHDDVPGGQSPTGFATLSPEALLAALERELDQADELRVLERDWLGHGALAREVGARIEAFRRRGGKIASANVGDAA